MTEHSANNTAAFQNRTGPAFQTQHHIFAIYCTKMFALSQLSSKAALQNILYNVRQQLMNTLAAAGEGVSGFPRPNRGLYASLWRGDDTDVLRAAIGPLH